MGKSRAHPRECGADTVPPPLARVIWGSSPRVRGRPGVWPKVGVEVGLIPASAGQTSRSGRIAAVPAGSSPRVRGRRHVRRGTARCSGLIPASAGQTRPHQNQSRQHTAHPRECGADWFPSLVSTHPVGSSPRVRGRRLRRGVLACVLGLIPASAGQTKNHLERRRWGRAHPRECGADKIPPAVRVFRLGSSPRVRGRLRRWPARFDRRGLIPASAGQTGCASGP